MGRQLATSPTTILRVRKNKPDLAGAASRNNQFRILGVSPIGFFAIVQGRDRPGVGLECLAPQGSFISLGVGVEIINDAITRTRADCGHIVRLPFSQQRFCTSKSRHASQLIGHWSVFQIPQTSDLTLLWNACSCVWRWVGIAGWFWGGVSFLYITNRENIIPAIGQIRIPECLPAVDLHASDRWDALLDVRIIVIRSPSSIRHRRNSASRRNRCRPNEADKGAAQPRLPH